MAVLGILAPIVAAVALVFAYGLASWIKKMDNGTGQMKEIAGAVREGAMAFSSMEYKAMIVVIIILFAIIGFFTSWVTAGLYVIGSAFSVLTGFFGTKAAASGNVRTVNAAQEGSMNKALKVAFRSGAVMGLCVAGFGLLGVGLIVAILGAADLIQVIIGFALGVSSMALFDCVGGGIYKKVAANLFDSYVGSMISAVVLAVAIPVIVPRFGGSFTLNPASGALFPMLLSAIGIIASMIGIMLVRGGKSTDPGPALNKGIYASNAIVLIGSIVLSKALLGTFNCAIASITGLIVGTIIGKITELYTSKMRLTVWLIICVAVGILVANAFAGLYGIALAAVGILSTTATVVAAYAYGPVSNKAGSSFAIGSAALTAIALFMVYSKLAHLSSVSLLDPMVLAGLFIGAILPFFFFGLTMKSAKAPLRGILAPGLLAIIAPLTVGIIMGAEVVGGMLAGAIISGVLIASIMANAGESFDSIKKYVEEGSSINIFIKLMAIVAIVFCEQFVKIGGLI